jgi:hypothetical protein
MAVTAQLDQAHLLIATAVDPVFYRSVYPELAGLDALAHYLQSGWREGRDPAPWFSTADYLATHADVALAGINPLHHYLAAGWREGRTIAPSRLADAYCAEALREGRELGWRAEFPALQRAAPDGAPQADVSPEAPREVVEAFDADYYLAVNPDVAAAGTDPLAHFLLNGWREGRDPSASFSLAGYLELHGDVAAAGINALVHYVLAGRAEGRAPKLDVGFRHRLIAELAPVEERVARAARATAALAPDDPARLAEAFGEGRTGWRDLHVTFSHDDYTENLGGLQLCLRREAARFAAMGRDHMHLFPGRPWPTVRLDGEPGALGVVWNGRTVGVFEPPAVIAAVEAAAAAAAPGRRSFAIHSLLGHAVDEVGDLVEAAGMTAGFFWLHDFAGLCAGVHLMRNDVADCGAPPADSAACGICAYLPMRARQTEEHRRLFARLALTVAAPSAAALDTWRGAGGGGRTAVASIIHPHARLAPRAGPSPGREPGPFRFAYVGLPAPHKGWPVFRELALKFGRDPRYRFLHLGLGGEPGLPVESRPVTVTADAPDAMRQAVEALQVDAALIWPLCRETFSFTAHEAAAGGAAVVTNPDSGNVAAFVADGGFGRMLADEAALDEAFASGEILALSRDARRPPLFDLVYSGLSADLVGDAA